MNTEGLSFSIALILIITWIIFVFIGFRKGSQGWVIRLSALVIFLGSCGLVFIYIRGLFDIVAFIFPILWIYIDEFLKNLNYKKKVIAIMRSKSSFGQAMISNIKNISQKELPDIELSFRWPEQDENINHQIIFLKDAVLERPDLILLMPSSHEAELIPWAIKAIKSGIPVITIDRHLPKSPFILEGIIPPIHVASDFHVGGSMAGEEMVRRLAGKGNIGIISGPNHSEVSQIRKLAFLDKIIERAPSMNIIFQVYTNWGEDEARELMDRKILDNIQLDGLFCCNDSLALGGLFVFGESPII